MVARSIIKGHILRGLHGSPQPPPAPKLGAVADHHFGPTFQETTFSTTSKPATMCWGGLTPSTPPPPSSCSGSERWPAAPPPQPCVSHRRAANPALSFRRSLPPPPRKSCHVSDARRHGPNPTQPRSCFGPSVPGPRCRATTGCIVSKPTIARGRAT